jgi:hypothetical protein
MFPAVTLLERRSWEVNQKKDNNSPFVGECSQPSHPLRDGYGGVPSRHTLCGTVMEMLQEDNDHPFVGWYSQPSNPLRDGHGGVSSRHTLCGTVMEMCPAVKPLCGTVMALLPAVTPFAERSCS